MTRLETFLLGAAFTIAAFVGVIVATGGHQNPAPKVGTDTAVGKCIQGERVLHRLGRGEAARACLDELDEVGPESFVRTWQGFETTDESW